MAQEELSLLSSKLEGQRDRDGIVQGWGWRRKRKPLSYISFQWVFTTAGILERKDPERQCRVQAWQNLGNLFFSRKGQEGQSQRGGRNSSDDLVVQRGQGGRATWAHRPENPLGDKSRICPLQANTKNRRGSSPGERNHTFGQESNIPLEHKRFMSTFGFSYILKINVQSHYKTEMTVEEQSVPLKWWNTICLCNNDQLISWLWVHLTQTQSDASWGHPGAIEETDCQLLSGFATSSLEKSACLDL